MQGAREGHGEDRGCLCAVRVRGAACRQLAAVQLLCVHRAAAAQGKAEGA